MIASPHIECGYCGSRYNGPCDLSELRSFDFGQRVPCDDCEGNAGKIWQMAPPEHAFPCAWGTLFVPRDFGDQAWLGEHRAQVARLGLFVFQSEDLGFVLGIDGAGFDFYRTYWEPLYQLRGPLWHTSDAA